MATTLKTLGDNIAHLRDALNLSPSQLASKAKVGRSTLWRIERGEKAADLTTLLKIKRALGVEWIGLLRGVE